MRCKLCKIEELQPYKVVHGTEIYQCLRCEIGQIKIEGKKPVLLDKAYSFNEYKKNEALLKKRLSFLVNTINRIKSSGSVLEIGSGFGLFASLLKEKGNYSLNIIEPSLSPHYLNKTRYDLNRMSLEQYLRINHKKFDLIVMLDVIEHLKDPFRCMQELRNRLNKNGILVIQTPNYKSLMQFIVKDWSWWMVEDHKWFFSQKSLTNILKKSGFDKVYQHTYEDWYDFKKNLDGNFVNISSELLRKTVKGFFYLFFIPFYFFLRKLIWFFGYGGLLFVIAK